MAVREPRMSARSLIRRRVATKDGAAKCSARGLGGRVSGILATTEAAPRILAIDGCPSLVENSLEQAGFAKYEASATGRPRMGKGKTPPTPEAIAKAAAAGGINWFAEKG